jgi:Probable Zinc-ribbon domain
MPPKGPPLSVAHPELVRQWHPSRNGSYSPDDVGVNFKAWWRCLKNPEHECEQSVLHRIRCGGCPMCNRDVALARNSLAHAFPEVAKRWHSARNGSLTPDAVMAGARRKVWWQCDKNSEHVYQARVKDKSSKTSGCPECKNESRKTLARVRPDLAAQWHPLRNGDLRPDHVTCSSRKSVWWRCSQNKKHEWHTIYSQRAHNQGLRLPFLFRLFRH